jgi:4-amino-4-deoxy-L-arabinose transferase-like glycosyltransferase
MRTQAMVLTGLCLVGAALAQHLLDKDESLRLAAAAYVLAAILFVALYGRQALEASRTQPVERKRRLNWLLVALAAALGVLAFPRFHDNLFRPDATLLWAAGLVLLGVAAWRADAHTRRGVPGPRRAFSASGVTVTWAHLALLVIMCIGAFYRLYKIDLIPAEMGCDLPHNYNNIRMILRREFLIFFPSVPGREALFFYLAAPFCRLFGLNHTTIKMAASLIGVLTLPVVYLLGKELYNREVGLFAAFFLSISHWHIIICRVGYRASTVPPLIALVWYFLVRGLKTHRRWFYALSGFCLGLGLYTYNAFMIAPLLVVLMLLASFLTGRGRALLADWDSVILLVLVAVIVFIPLGRYAYEQPQLYGYRAATRITSMEQPLPKNVLATLLKTTSKALLMFNYHGDGVFVANVPFMRELGFSAAMLFVLGVAYVAWRWRHGDNLTVLIALGVMLLPTILSLAFPHEVPNAIRAIGALPAATLLPAIALALVRERLALLLPARPSREMHLRVAVDGAQCWEWRWRWSWPWRQALVALLVVALAAEVRAVYPIYFGAYYRHLPAGNYSISLGIARAIDDFMDNGETYVKMVPYWYDGNAVRAQLRRADQSWHNELDALRPEEPPFTGPRGKFVVIVHPQDAEALRVLREAFPKGIELKHLDNNGEVAFLTFYGER